MSLQIFSRAAQALGVVLEAAKASVAVVAEKAADAASIVAMVYRHLLDLATTDHCFWIATDGAHIPFENRASCMRRMPVTSYAADFNSRFWRLALPPKSKRMIGVVRERLADHFLCNHLSIVPACVGGHK